MNTENYVGWFVRPQSAYRESVVRRQTLNRKTFPNIVVLHGRKRIERSLRQITFGGIDLVFIPVVNRTLNKLTNDRNNHLLSSE